MPHARRCGRWAEKGPWSPPAAECPRPPAIGSVPFFCAYCRAPSGVHCDVTSALRSSSEICNGWDAAAAPEADVQEAGGASGIVPVVPESRSVIYSLRLNVQGHERVSIAALPG